jgi:hypothetical protein
MKPTEVGALAFESTETRFKKLNIDNACLGGAKRTVARARARSGLCRVGAQLLGVDQKSRWLHGQSFTKVYRGAAVD